MMQALGVVVLGFAMGAMAGVSLVFIVITWAEKPPPSLRPRETGKEGTS